MSTFPKRKAVQRQPWPCVKCMKSVFSASDIAPLSSANRVALGLMTCGTAVAASSESDVFLFESFCLRRLAVGVIVRAVRHD